MRSRAVLWFKRGGGGPAAAAWRAGTAAAAAQYAQPQRQARLPRHARALPPCPLHYKNTFVSDCMQKEGAQQKTWSTLPLNTWVNKACRPCEGGRSCDKHVTAYGACSQTLHAARPSCRARRSLSRALERALEATVGAGTARPVAVCSMKADAEGTPLDPQ